MTLKDRLVKYMSKHHTEWVSSGELQRLTALHTNYTPRTAVRRLQELYEENALEREIRRGHAFYRIRQENAPTGQIGAIDAREKLSLPEAQRIGQELIAQHFGV